ncbi:hypothetical protein FYJ38_05875 [Clostridium sp. WB02_MRS01]|uniref:S-layer homology domain-containing protein n=1 Tax=Clostridium sp. WB02_MRS01 TaxID=2605777 RepID=UPI0012B363E0|nr:S-layer homology domain-containing protein [Clostridium sp. WB02_MRS01]MSS08171.1 hypothetical protein [Clostridium sp. WB02_MRS01]
MKQIGKRIGSLLLSVCMVLTLLPVSAFAEEGIQDSGASFSASGEITAFASLVPEVSAQTVETGTAEEELNLPDELAVTVTTGAAITADVSGDDIATDSDAQKPETQETETTVAVSDWTSNPAYDADAAGDYTFTPTLDLPEGVVVSEGVNAPKITVTVSEAIVSSLKGGIQRFGSNPVTGTMDIGGTTVSDLTQPANGTGWNWNAATATLTLDSGYSGSDNGIYIECGSSDSITLNLTGDVTINSNWWGIDVAGISGGWGGSLTIQAGSYTLAVSAVGDAIQAHEGLTIESGTVVADGGGGGLVSYSGDVAITGSANVAAIGYTDPNGPTWSSNGIQAADGNVLINTSGVVNVTGGKGAIVAGGIVTIESGTVNANGGSFALVGENSGIHITGGTITTNTTGIANGDIHGDLNVSGSGTGVTINGDVLAGFSSLNGDLTVSDGTVVVVGTVAGSTTVTGGTASVNGQTIPPMGGTATGTMDIGGQSGLNLGSNQGGSGWAWTASTATLNLANDYTGEPIAINCQNTDTIYLVYTGNSSITSSAASTIYCKGSLNINGSGGMLTLDSTGSNSAYCAIDVYGALTIGGSADVNATCAGSGTSPAAVVIYGKQGVTVVGGANVTATSTGTDASGIWVEFGDIAFSTSGTVTANGNGAGSALAMMNGSKLNMSGGNLALTGTPLKGVQFTEIVITGGSITVDGTSVYNTVLTLSGISAPTQVASVSSPVSGYGISSEFTNAFGELCFLLPVGSQTVTLLAGGNTYTGAANVTADHAATATLTMVGGTPTYLVTVDSGTGGGNYAQGLTVTIMASASPQGQRFKEWTITPAVTFVSGTSAASATAQFTMPAQAVTVTAVYENIPAGVTSVTGITLNQTNASLYYNTTPNTVTLAATITPADATDKTVTWQSSDTAVATVDTNGKVTAVGNGTATITATTADGGYNASCTVTVTTYSRGDGGGSSSGSSSGSNSTTIKPEKKPDQPVTVSTPITAAAGTNGTANASIPEKAITDAIIKAQDDAKAQGKTANGISVGLDVTMPQGATALTVTLTQNSLQRLVSAGVASLEVNGSPVKVSFEKQALAEILKQSSGDINITIAPNTRLSDSAKVMIGTRPAYSITISYVKDGKTVSIASLGSGTATLSIPYTLASGEAVGYLFGVYVDANGNPVRVDGSAYDANSGSVLISIGHFSTYGVGYTAPSAKFTDIEKHWAKESIDYAVGRGLLSGTSDTTFAPDNAMTRGILVTALGRLAGVDIELYTTNSFTDVTLGSAFQPYIEWAYKKGIIQGISNGQFAPDRTISREEIAVIITNYAKATGYKLPVVREAITYADNDSIGSAYKDAITAMQQAGVMMGSDGNRFNPKSSATCAEVLSMLHRYIMLTIAPDTAQGWTLNDAGQYLYYRDGKALTGWWDININGNNKRYYFAKDGIMVFGKWLEIDGKWYYFYDDGSLAVNTSIDGYEVDENGMRKTK